MLKSALACLFPLTAFAVEPCRIEIIDKENGWPVPMVELRTTNETRHVSDNSGLIAIDDPDLKFEPLIQEKMIVVAAPAQDVFDVLADPAQHSTFDGSGTVRSV